MVDGCSRIAGVGPHRAPARPPGLIGTAAFAFLAAWGEFIFAVVLTSGLSVAPLTIAISQFFGQFGSRLERDHGTECNGDNPTLVIFIFLQRWVVQGMTAGAVK